MQPALPHYGRLRALPSYATTASRSCRPRRPALARRRARASPRQIDHLRGAARAAVGVHARRDARPDHVASASPTSASSSTGATSRPIPTARRKPDFDASDPDAYPADKWDNLDGLIAAAKAHGVAVTLTLTGPVPRGRRSAKKRQPHRPGPEGVRRVRDRDRPPLRRPRRARGRSGTSPTSRSSCKPQYVRRQAGVAEALPQALPGRLRRACARRRPTPNDTILIGETSPRGNSNVVHPLAFLRGMLCLDSKYRKSKSCGELRGRRLRAPRVHDRAPARASSRRRQDDVTIGVLPRLVTALDKAGKAGALPDGPADLPDRVRDPVARRTRSPASRSPSRPPTWRSPSTWRTSTRASCAFSQYLLSDDPPRTSRLHATAASRAACAPPTARRSRPTRASGCRSRSRSTARSDVLWGLVRPQRARSTVTIDAQAQGQGRGRELKTLDTTGDRRLRAQDHAPRPASSTASSWTAPDGATYTGPAVRAY